MFKNTFVGLIKGTDKYKIINRRKALLFFLNVKKKGRLDFVLCFFLYAIKSLTFFLYRKRNNEITEQMQEVFIGYRYD